MTFGFRGLAGTPTQKSSVAEDEVFFVEALWS
jgi:hypothetical protein